MNRDEWTGKLAEAIRPRSPRPTAVALGRMLQFLADVPDHAFTDASLRYAANKLTKTPNLAALREVLDGYLHTLNRPVRPIATETDQERESREWDTRQAFLRRDWDDPAGILRKVDDCAGALRLLTCLGSLVARWAPQHLGLMPPHVLETLAIEGDSDLPAIVELRRMWQAQRPERTVAAQRESLTPTPTRTDTPRYLTPEQLDAINPLPNGRKRA